MSVSPVDVTTSNEIALSLAGEDATGRDDSERYSSLSDELCERGWFGQKTKKGWYTYDPAQPRKPLENSDTLELIRAHRKAQV